METTTFERAVHLLLFVVGGLAFAVASLAVLERMTGADGEPSIRWHYVVWAVAAFLVLALVEATFHIVR